LCRPASSPQAITAGCTGSDGAALTDSSTACGMCSGGFFLFRGGCYSQMETPGSEICTAASGGKCTACKADNGLFKNPVASPTLGSECILCSDATDRDGVTGVANCNKCTAPGSAGAATCNTCQDGFYKDNNGACAQCNTNSCLTCETSATQCTSCSGSKYLKDSQCVEGASNGCGNGKYADPQSNTCAECGIADCTACKYNATVSKPQCTACNSKIVKIGLDGTTTCVTAGDCAQNDTEGAYFLTKNSDKCLLCNDKSDTSDAVNTGIEGCGTCKKADPTQALTCTACTDGYYDSGNGNPAICVACGANCATCTKDTKDQCSTCKPGYFKQSDSPGTCTPCDDADSGIPGCATCTFSGSLACNSCKPNYKQSGSSPITCTKTCEDETACGGTAGSCKAAVLDDKGVFHYYCSQCADNNQYLIDGICNSAKGSNTCAKGVCTSCTTGYFLYMGGCYSTANTPGNLMCTAATNGICTTAANSRYFKIPGASNQQQSVLGCGNPLGTNTTSTNAYVGVEDCRTCTAPSEASNGAMAAAKCTACDEGKKPNLAGTGCSTCGIPGCSACKADNMCEACGDGYRLEGDACVRTGGGNLSTGAIAGISVTKSSSGLCC
ncbi:Variant-specific surface protein, partial [Giardia duodenalis]